MNPQDVARAWLGVASQAEKAEPAPFFRFMTAWIAFNALYASTHPRGKSEREQVRAFAEMQDAVNRHYHLLKVDEEYLKSIAAIKEHGVWDDRKRKHCQIGDDLELKDVLDCTYQIRCNLFHGDKFPDNDRDKRLVEAGFKITSEIVRAFV
jgi:hypothetical protein